MRSQHQNPCWSLVPLYWVGGWFEWKEKKKKPDDGHYRPKRVVFLSKNITSNLTHTVVFFWLHTHLLVHIHTTGRHNSKLKRGVVGQATMEVFCCAESVSTVQELPLHFMEPETSLHSIYLLYYTIPSTQHKSQSYRYMFRLNKSSSGVSKNHN